MPKLLANLTRSSVHKTAVFLAICLVVASNAAAAKKKHPAFESIQDNPKLPRVLLIGDSISIGYTQPVRELFKGKANMHRVPTNAGPTTRGLESLDRWLGKGKWDVIHFNWGLHDLKYIDSAGNLVDTAKGHIQVPIEQYEKNLRQLVHRLKKTKAKLIWAATTPVPLGSKGRIQGDAAKYNAVAAKIMKAEGTTINDLYGFALTRLEKIQRPRNVHYE